MLPQQLELEKRIVNYALSLTGAPFIPHVKLHTSRSNQMRLTGESYLRHGHLAVGAEKGFDCSGFVQNVFANSAGVYLPGHTIEIYCGVERGYIAKTALMDVELDEMTEADIMFFGIDKPHRLLPRIIPAHVAIYAGNDEVIHSSRRTKGVGVTPLGEMLPMLLAVKRVEYAR